MARTWHRPPGPARALAVTNSAIPRQCGRRFIRTCPDPAHRRVGEKALGNDHRGKDHRDTPSSCRRRCACSRIARVGVGLGPAASRHLTCATGQHGDSARKGLGSGDLLDNRALQERSICRPRARPETGRRRSRQLELDGRDTHDARPLADRCQLRPRWSPPYVVRRGLTLTVASPRSGRSPALK
jgi:hypothetical protein